MNYTMNNKYRITHMQSTNSTNMMLTSVFDSLFNNWGEIYEYF